MVERAWYGWLIHARCTHLANGVGDVSDLGTGRARVDNHALKHLCGGDDRLANSVTLPDDHLLCGIHLQISITQTEG
jgi:hypothetical protein